MFVGELGQARLRSLAQGPGRAVDQNVHAPKGLCGALHHRSDGGVVTSVGGDGHDAPPRLSGKLGCRLVQRLLATRNYGDVYTLQSQLTCHGLAYASAAAGDDSRLTLQLQVHGSFSLCLVLGQPAV